MDIENRTKYVVDSRYFNGSVQTSMRDGMHCDYYGRTIEQIREEDNNPHLIVVSDSRVNILLKRYKNALQTPFEEISEERYYELMDCVPPIRLCSDFFFVGEGYYSSLYSFCFKLRGKFYEGLRSICTPDKELYRQINEFSKVISYRAELIKDAPVQVHHALETKYYIIDRMGKKIDVGHFYKQKDDRDTQYSRNNLAMELISLRKNNYQYLKYFGKYQNIFDLFNHICDKKLTIHHINTMFRRIENGVTFSGYLKDPYEPFCYFIYDREIMQHIINQLRTVKRQK